MVAAILLVAVALRVAGWRWGLPDADHLFPYHPDEYHSLRGLLSLLFYDLNPHFFNYGSLYLYLVAAAVVLLHPSLFQGLWLQQLLSGEAGPLLASWTWEARLVTLVAGVLTVYLMYRLAARLWSPRLGLLAAALLAALPLHVLLSHYATVDVTQSLFLLLALYLTVALASRPDARTAWWAGVACGLAASTKYNGLLVIVAPLLATALVCLAPGPGHRGKLLLQRWGLILAGAALAFAVTSPYTFLAWGEARTHILFELRHMREGERLPVLAEPSGWLFHLRHLLAPGMGLLLLLGLFGAGWSLWRRDRRCYPLVLFALLWLVMISLALVRYPRYELPLAVALTPLAVAPLAGLARRGRILYSTLLGVAAALMLLWSVQIGWGLGARNPRGEALAFILAHSQPAESVGLIEEPWFADPPLDYCNGGRVLPRNSLWQRYRRPVRPLEITGLLPSALRAEAPAWFVTTDFGVSDGLVGRDPETLEFMSALREEYHPAEQFGGVPLTLVPWRLGPDWRYPWPRITVWQRND